MQTELSALQHSQQILIANGADRFRKILMLKNAPNTSRKTFDRDLSWTVQIETATTSGTCPLVGQGIVLALFLVAAWGITVPVAAWMFAAIFRDLNPLLWAQVTHYRKTVTGHNQPVGYNCPHEI